MSGLFSDLTILALEKALDASGQRQRVAAHNIANVNTAGFKRSYVAFEDELEQALGKGNKLGLRRSDKRHLGRAGSIAEVRPQLKQDQTTSMRADGNNVDIDLENTELAMHTIMYTTVATRLNQKLGQLRYVINGGR